MSFSVGALRGSPDRGGIVDHRLARRMLVNQVRLGRLRRDEVCDAHPELIRAANASGARLKVPHMGWSQVEQAVQHPLWSGIENGSRFYFVHSYWVSPAVEEVIAGTFDYGVQGCAAMARDNLFAVQFHPEKSHEAGLRLLRNFLNWDGTC